ncbi:MAG TPA: thiamine-phosphate kinase [Terriglobales bacterium]|nr:thiamine-phosphate kinase [Terriglobales bacterium]
MPTLRDLGEFEVLRRLIAARPAPSRPGDPRAGVIVDSGDDAAVLRIAPERDLVATTDAFVEGEHFLPGWSKPREAGARLARANLSDLAAMAAEPRWALLSVGARGASDLDDLLAFQSGLADAMAELGAALVGGNLTAATGAAWYSLTLLGTCERGRAWTRFGARPGDLLAATGSIGRAGAAVRLARAREAEAREPRWAPLMRSWLAPAARVALALALRGTDAVTAAIDVSDGFAGDLAHLCEASGVGAEVEEAAWPADPLIDEAAAVLGLGADAIRFGPSDDYELLLAIDPAGRPDCERAAAALGVPLAFVGRFTGAPDLITLRSRRREGATGTVVRPLAGAGYDHFGDHR